MLNCHAPVITIRPKNGKVKKPWIKGETLNKIRIKQAAAIRKDYDPCPENVSNFRKLKLDSERATLKAKQDFYHGRSKRTLEIIKSYGTS